MTRTPVNVLVLPFRRRTGAAVEFAIFRRADDPGELWQGVAGGVEEGETPLEAARRELAEETGLVAPPACWLTLDAQASVPAAIFRNSPAWGPDVFVVQEVAFGVDVGDVHELDLSHEHHEYQWLGLEAASRLVRYDSNRTALWELNERLTRVTVR